MKNKNKIIDLLKTYRFDSIIFINFFKLLSVILIIVIAFGMYIYRSAVNVIENEFVTINENHITRMSDLSESIFREIEYIATNVALDKSVGAYMMSAFSERDYEKIKLVQDKILSYNSINKYIDSIYVYSELSQRICSTDNECNIESFSDNSWLPRYEQSKGELIVVMPRKKIGGYPYVLTFIKLTDSINMPGAIVININLQAYGNVIDNYVEDDMRFYIVGTDKTVIYSKNEELLQKPADSDPTLLRLLDNNKTGMIKFLDGGYAFSKKKSYYYEWDYMSVTSIENYRAQLINVRFLWMVILFGAVLAGVLLSSILAFSILKPFESIMDVFDDDNIKAIENMRDNEVKYFAKKIISVIGNNRKLKEELDRKLRLYNEAQLLALQSQISPHFINNTLNIINMSIIEEVGLKSVSSKLLIALSKILKAGFETDKIIITIREELEYTRLYTDLLRRRYENLFDVIWEVDESVYDNKILKLCLQPLIENSVYHGMSKSENGGYIKITLKNDNGGLYVSVEDNGCGMDAMQLKETKESVFKEGIGSSHIGIKNVYMRLRIVFGDDVDFGIESEHGKGTKVWFRF